VLHDFLDERLLTSQERPWFVDITNFKAVGVILKNFDCQQRKKLLKDANQYVWDEPHIFKIGVDNLLRRCVTTEKANSIVWHCHKSLYGGHFNGERTTKIL